MVYQCNVAITWWRMGALMAAWDLTPSQICWNTFVKMMTVRRRGPPAMFLSSDQCFLNPVPPQYPLHFSRQQHHLRCRMCRASQASQVKTPRTVAKAVLWTTGCPSFLPSMSPSVQWCCSQNHYKVTTRPATMTKIFMILVSKLLHCGERLQCWFLLISGLNKVMSSVSPGHDIKQNVYHEIKIIQDNAREVTKSFAELCRYTSPQHNSM